ncbi:hypothetical protein SBA4_3840011 [Candidatus Sulfopaludibacter sp. SbA4]|nr:hypothetical protein SBA4_3840011 [Candidatus Sulfopaludibacter sp. SbA4]
MHVFRDISDLDHLRHVLTLTVQDEPRLPEVGDEGLGRPDFPLIYLGRNHNLHVLVRPIGRHPRGESPPRTRDC